MRSVRRDLSALRSWRVLPTAEGASGVMETSAGIGPMPVNMAGKRAGSTDSAKTASMGASIQRSAIRCTAMRAVYVVPAKTGTQVRAPHGRSAPHLDSRLRGNDGLHRGCLAQYPTDDPLLRPRPRPRHAGQHAL